MIRKSPRLLYSCLFYIIAYAGLSTLNPLLAIFLRSLGLCAADVGIIAGSRPFALFLGINLWGSVADRWQMKKIIHCVNLASYVLLCLLLAQLSPGFSAPFVHTCQGDDEARVKLGDQSNLQRLGHAPGCRNSSQATTTATLGYDEVHQRIAEFAGRRLTGQTQTLCLILGLMVIGDFFASSWASLADLATLDHLGASARRYFGRHRLWGSLGLGLGTFCFGLIAQTTRIGSMSGEVVDGNYRLCLYISAGLWLLAAIVASQFRFQEYKVGQANVGLLKALRQVRRPTVLVYLCAVFVLGCNMGLMMNFIFWYMQDLNASQLVVGVAGLVAQSSDIFVQLVSVPIIARLGHVRTMYLAILTYAGRHFLLASIHNKWLALIPQAMFGLSFGLPWASMANFVHDEAEPGTEAFMQGALHAVHWGLGCGTGAVVGGILIHKYSARETFRAAAYTAFISWLVFVVLQQVLERYKQRKHKEKGYELVDHSVEDGQSTDE